MKFISKFTLKRILSFAFHAPIVHVIQDGFILVPLDKKRATHKQEKKMAHTYDLIEAKISMEQNTEKRETMKSLPLESFFRMLLFFFISFQFREVKLKGIFFSL